MTQVSEVLTLKIENLGLKLQQLQAQANALLTEQRGLVEQARAEVNASPGSVFNTETRLFQAPTGPTPFKAPTARERKRVKGAG